MWLWARFEDITVRAQLVNVQRALYDKIDPQNPKKDLSIHRIDPKFHENGKGLVHGDLNGDGYADLIGHQQQGQPVGGLAAGLVQ